MPSAMSHPSTAVGAPSSTSTLDDDSTLESEILLSLCTKILAECDLVTSSMRSLISACYTTLNADLFGDSSICDEEIVCETEFPIEELLESFVPETEFPSGELAESFVPEIEFPIGELAESFVPETEFEMGEISESFVPDTEFEGWNCSRKRKAASGVVGVSRAGLASVKAAKVEKVEKGVEAMLRILLPAYFTLVRSFDFCWFLLVRSMGDVAACLCCYVGLCEIF